MNSILIQQIKMPLEHNDNDIEYKIHKILKVKKENINSYKIVKKSIDARNTNNIKIVYSIEVVIKNMHINKLINNKNIMSTKDEEYRFPNKNREILDRPIIIGSGPAGLFCGLILAENNYKPIILERGKDVDNRVNDVNSFFTSNTLNIESNIQFGEGGAGTFSDGKINTLVKDKFFRKEKVLKEFIKAGAPEEIMYVNKPHIGTDYLVTVVKNIRNKINDLGGEVCFNSKVTDLIIKDNEINGVVVNDEKIIKSSNVILAIGHSARDTFKVLKDHNINMEQKGFAIGLRIEHPQKMISRNQYGDLYNHPNLPVADYKLTYKSTLGRGVYSFCMCPGGFVVNSSSEIGHVVCNGMSNFIRNETNANSAIIVNVLPEDFGSNDILAGVEFQRKWEKTAFEVAGSNYSLPIQLFGDFLNNKESKEFGDVKPNTKGYYTFANLNNCLPSYVLGSLKEGILYFDKKIKGFARNDAILTGVETRSSSPIRIIRNDNYMSNIQGLYPCGEGAGYAGGIMSAAMDGIKVAEQVGCSVY